MVRVESVVLNVERIYDPQFRVHVCAVRPSRGFEELFGSAFAEADDVLPTVNSALRIDQT